MTQRKRKVGRKPGPPEQRKVRITIALDPADHDWLHAQAERLDFEEHNNVSAAVRRLIRAARTVGPA